MGEEKPPPKATDTKASKNEKYIKCGAAGAATALVANRVIDVNYLQAAAFGLGYYYVDGLLNSKEFEKITAELKEKPSVVLAPAAYYFALGFVPLNLSPMVEVAVKGTAAALLTLRMFY